MAKEKKGGSSSSGVGYGSPPREHQFKPGKSGNPRGRPKGSLNAATVLGNMLREKVTVTQNGRRKSLSKFEALMKQQVNKAAAGDTHAFKVIMNLVMGFREGELQKPIIDDAFLASLNDQELEMAARLVGMLVGCPVEEDSNKEPVYR